MLCPVSCYSGDRIRLRPLAFYANLLQLTYEASKCAFQEHIWHIVFGEASDLSRDRCAAFYYEPYNELSYPPDKPPVPHVVPLAEGVFPFGPRHAAV